MGQRANLLTVSGGQYQIFYTHHRANTLDKDLFWGPDYTLGFIRAQQRIDPPQWLDDVWAEGGAVMDLDHRVLLWFGGEDARYDVPFRRAHVRLMSHLWPSWSVRWAEGGVTDMADYVAVPRTTVLRTGPEPALKTCSVAEALCADEPDWSDTLASIHFTRTDFRVNRLSARCKEILDVGDAIVPAAMAANWPDTLSADWSGFGRRPAAGGHQCGGFHVNVPARSLDFWTADPTESADVQRQVQDRWPGWHVDWHGSRFESQLESADDRIEITLPTPHQSIDRLRNLLLYPDRDSQESGADAILAVAKAITGQTGETVTGINPAALYDARLSIPLTIRQRLFAAAVAAG